MADDGLEVVAAPGLEAETAQVLCGEGEGKLVVLHPVATLVEQALRVEHGDGTACLVLGRALGADDRLEEPRDADARRPCSEENHALVGKLLAPMPQGGEDAAADDPGGSLNVVVEAGQAVAVVVEQPDGVVLLEVLPLQQRVGVDLLDRLHEPVDEGVISVAAKAALLVAEVERVVEELLVVGAAVEGDRQGQLRVDAGAGYVEGELADGDAHASGSLIAQAEYALVVGGDDQADAGLAGISEQLRNALDVVGRDPDAPGPAEDVAVLPAGAPHRRGVDDRGELLEVVDEEAVEEGLVPVLQRGETDVLLEVVSLAAEVLELQGYLFLDGGDAPGQQAPKAEGGTLVLGEGGVLVDRGAVEQLTASRRRQHVRQVTQTGSARARHDLLVSLGSVQVTRFAQGLEGPNVTSSVLSARGRAHRRAQRAGAVVLVTDREPCRGPRKGNGANDARVDCPGGVSWPGGPAGQTASWPRTVRWKSTVR